MNGHLKAGLIVLVAILSIVGAAVVCKEIKHSIDDYIWKHSDHIAIQCSTERTVVRERTIHYASNGTVTSDTQSIKPDYQNILMSDGCLTFHSR